MAHNGWGSKVFKVCKKGSKVRWFGWFDWISWLEWFEGGQGGVSGLGAWVGLGDLTCLGGLTS